MNYSKAVTAPGSSDDRQDEGKDGLLEASALLCAGCMQGQSWRIQQQHGRAKAREQAAEIPLTG